MVQITLSSTLKTAIGAVIFWSFLLITLFIWNYYIQKEQVKDLTINDAKVTFNKDVLYREWGAKHGGVYVPVTKETKPNPYLEVDERDITTPKGKKLTLMNPAYMTRQIYQLAKEKYGIQGHITSLNPINPINKPDAWEKHALTLFEKGIKEYYEIINDSSGQTLRYMRPFITKQACLKCHSRQGYKVGDIRGGISITLPMEGYIALMKKHLCTLFFTYLVIWIIGLLVILLTTNRKIKHRKEKEKLQLQLNQAQKMEMIGALACGVAHDFNNLLTVINGYSEMVLSSLKAKDPLYKHINEINKAGRRAENLTRQLLAFSRKQIHRSEIIEINSVVLEMDKMLRRLIGEDISVNMVLTENLPKIKADKSQIEQVLMNLVVNARDAVNAVSKADYQKKITIETGWVRLDKDFVEEHPDSGEGIHVFFSVSDNGIGMDEATKQRIFEPFFTTKDKFKGTGLGLATVYGIIKQNNGSIYVYSEPHEGTLFKIYWPAATEKINRKTVKTEVSQNATGNESILLVEDDTPVSQFATEALTAQGYKVHNAVNGKVALERIKSEESNFDLIITDLIMPELNGKDLVEKIKKIHPDTKALFVSGYTDAHIVHNGLLEEGVNFVQKPYSADTLTRAVRRVLDGSKR